jgi:hydrogenase maturation protease
MTSPTLVLGVGNAFRRDDAAGVLVARGLRAAGLSGVTVREESGEGTSLLEAWEGADEVFVVDAVRSGAPPGTITRFEVPGDTVPVRYFHYSTHAFSVAEAIELGRELGLLPRRLVVVGIEGGEFGAGEDPTPAVRAAVDRLTRELTTELGFIHDGSEAHA